MTFELLFVLPCLKISDNVIDTKLGQIFEQCSCILVVSINKDYIIIVVTLKAYSYSCKSQYHRILASC